MKKNLNHQLKMALATVCLVAPMSSMAVTWGTGADSGTSTCASFSATCDVGTTPSGSGPYVDNVSGATADSSVSDIRGAAEGHASIINTSGIEMIHLAGQASAGEIANSTMWGLNTYTYSGMGSTITLDVDLTGTLSNPNGSAFTSISASVFILDPLEIDSEGTTDFSGLFGEGIFPLDSADVEIGGTETDSITLMLNDGDEFSIWARMHVSAGFGGQAQAMNSLDLTFSDITGLTSAASVSAVPVPAAVWLFGSGLLGLVGVARRRK